MARYFRPDWNPWNTMGHKEDLINNPLMKEDLINNPLMNKLVTDLLVNRSYEKSIARDGSPYGEMDYRMWNFIKENARPWRTWVNIKVPQTTNKEGKIIPAHEVPYAIPLFFPPAWYSLNFWRSLGATSEKIKKPDGTETDEIKYNFGGKTPEVPSLLEKFWEGLRLDEVDFSQYSDQSTDWDNVNRVQLAKGLVMMFLSYNFSSEGANAYGNFMARPLNINTLKDWEKRMGRLGVRGENVVAGITGMLTYLPFAIKVIAEQTGVAALADPSIGSPSERLKIYLKYQRSISKLKINSSYLAKTKGVNKTALVNFNKTYSMFADFYSRIDLDWALKAQIQNQEDERKEGNLLDTEFNEVLRLNNLHTVTSG
jgi:hypothetical protein